MAQVNWWATSTIAVVLLAILAWILGWWPLILSWLDSNSGLISAVAALLSAIAAAVIARFSARTWKVSRDQADVAEQQHDLLQRDHKLRTDPILQIHQWKLDWDSVLNPNNTRESLEHSYVLVNPGFTPIYLHSASADVEGYDNSDSAVSVRPFGSHMPRSLPWVIPAQDCIIADFTTPLNIEGDVTEYSPGTTTVRFECRTGESPQPRFVEFYKEL